MFAVTRALRRRWPSIALAAVVSALAAVALVSGMHVRRLDGGGHLRTDPLRASWERFDREWTAYQLAEV